MTQAAKTKPAPDGELLTDIHDVPGHLIRRCQQIAVAIFLEEFRDTSLTPVQYAALATVHRRPGIDQITLVNLIAVDRSTIGAILRGLEERGFLKRVTPKHNQRIKQLFILPKGEALLRSGLPAIKRVQERILAPLPESEQATFLKLLARIVEGNNEFSRAPMKAEPEPDARDQAGGERCVTA